MSDSVKQKKLIPCPLFYGGFPFICRVLAGGKVEICHNSPDEPGLLHITTIPENTISAHLAHGDTVGQCDSGCEGPTECNDGNFAPPITVKMVNASTYRLIATTAFPSPKIFANHMKGVSI